MVNFRFRLYTVPDNVYGVRDSETGEWNGIVRQLMDRRADIAVASMTINYARETVIDFTKPFMNLGISILFKVRVEIIIVVNLTCLFKNENLQFIKYHKLQQLCFLFCSGPRKYSNGFVFLYESTGYGNLAVHPHRLCVGFHHHLDSGSFLSL